MYRLIVLDNLRYINQNNIVVTINFKVTYQHNIGTLLSPYAYITIVTT